MLVFACGGSGKNIFHVDIVSTLDEGRDIEMVSMPGGTYAMGSDYYPVLFIDTVSFNPLVGELIVDTSQNTERPIHIAQISSFLISSTEITQEQYFAVMGVNPSHYQSEADLPVETVTWFDATDFCNGLSEMLGYTPCYDRNYNCDYGADGFRLPTETEWEYAARAGVETEYSSGDDPSDLNLVGWYAVNSENKIHKVATRQPNTAGIYDMHGNVKEWCQDYFDYYNCGAQVNPTGPEMGALRLTRGGSWADQSTDCRSAARMPIVPSLKYSILGFRIVRRN